MIKILSAIAVAAFLFTPLYPVFAQSSSPSAKPALERLQQIKEKVGDRKEVIASRAAERKMKFDLFRDKKKASAAAKIETNLEKINAQRTSMMMQKLDKMVEILTKLNAVVATASTEQDKTAAENAIASAESSVNAAKTAVTNQSQKTYTIVSTTESKLKTDAQSQRTQLHTDLQIVQQQIVGARKDVSTAISTTRSTLGGSK